MGGKAAESVFYGNDFVSLGANQDLKQANNLAKRMIGNYGMGDELEVFFDENVGEDAFSNRGTVEQYSDATKNTIDKEKLELVKEAYNEAKRLLLKYNDKLIYFSELLLKDTVIYNKDIIDDIIF
jgi:cell division protease FtsH